jgi:hypothetical protein
MSGSLWKNTMVWLMEVCRICVVGRGSVGEKGLWSVRVGGAGGLPWPRS